MVYVGIILARWIGLHDMFWCPYSSPVIRFREGVGGVKAVRVGSGPLAWKSTFCRFHSLDSLYACTCMCWWQSAGSGGAPTCRHRTVIIRLMIGNSGTIPCNYLSVVYGFGISMSYRFAARNRRQFSLMAFNFYGDLSKIVGGQPSWPRKMINRRVDVTKSVLFALLRLCLYVRS